MFGSLVSKLRYPLLGAAAAALALTTATALAGSGVGDVFNLGQANTVNVESSLSGNTSGGPQLRVENSATTQNAFGVLGRITAGAPGTQSAGLRGINSGTNGNGFGIWGFHQSNGIGVLGETPTGTGVAGRHTGSSGTTPGVDGQTASTAPGAVGVLGELTAASPGFGSAAIRGDGGAGTGVLGKGAQAGGSFLSLSGNSGVVGCSSPNGAAFPCNGALPFSDRITGGQFLGNAANGIGVYACASGLGCGLISGFPIGGELFASGNHAVGVLASTSAGPGDGGTIGVSATATGDGAIGGKFFTPVSATASIGVSGEAAASDGVGVEGVANTGANAVGVLGSSTSGLAGRFEGNMHVTGKVTRAYTAGTTSQATPIAYAFINGGGSPNASASTPNVTSTYDSVNKRYDITIAGESYNLNNYVTTVTPASGGIPLLATTNSASGHLLIKIFNLSGTAVQSAFGFVTYKP